MILLTPSDDPADIFAFLRKEERCVRYAELRRELSLRGTSAADADAIRAEIMRLIADQDAEDNSAEGLT